VLENKNMIVDHYVKREFEEIQPLMQQNEKLSGSNFQNAISLASTVLQMH